MWPGVQLHAPVNLFQWPCTSFGKALPTLWFEKYLRLPPLQGTRHCELHPPSFLHHSSPLMCFQVCLQEFMKMRKEIVTSKISAAL